MSLQNDNGDPAWAHVVKTLVSKFQDQNKLVIADSRFHSTVLQEWGVEKRIGFCMSTSGNPVCTPEFMRNKSNPIVNYLKACGRGHLLTFHSDKLNYTTTLYHVKPFFFQNWFRCNSRSPRMC